MRPRPATQDDAEAIARVSVASWRAAYSGLLPAAVLVGLSVAERAERWGELIAAGTSVVVVDGGFASWGPGRDGDPTIGELYALYVLPGHWGTRAGYALHEAAVRGLRDASFGEATLWVLAGNERAIGFYARQGWRPDGGTKQEERTGAVLSEVRYRRAL